MHLHLFFFLSNHTSIERQRQRETRENILLYDHRIIHIDVRRISLTYLISCCKQIKCVIDSVMDAALIKDMLVG